MSQNSQRNHPDDPLRSREDRTTVLRGGHEQDQDLRSSANQIINFVEDSTIWYDFENWLDERIEILHVKLEQAETLEEMREYQGAIRNARDVKNLPAQFLDELERDKDED